LGVSGNVTSPTFNILKCYNGDKYDFYHIDAYRLEGVKQDLGLEEYIEGEDVCFVEWGEYISYLLPDDYLKMDIFGEEYQYLSGMIGQLMFKVARRFLCEHCRAELEQEIK
jgi:tRNA threonylcarbamoyladenosine biosynthesis protein TsaE